MLLKIHGKCAGNRLERDVPSPNAIGGIEPWKSQRHITQLNNNSMCVSPNEKVARCRRLSLAGCRPFSERPFDISETLLTPRMPFKMHYCPLTSTWNNSEGRLRCPHG